jgi:predicted aspartyl protease
LPVVTDHDAVKAAVEDVATPALSAIEATRTTGEQVPHALVKVRLGGLNEEMDVVVHKAIGRELPIAVPNHLGKVAKEVAPLDVAVE